MCFSATASFVAGGVLTTLGAATLYQVRDNRKAIPVALIPVFFGIQQLLEGGVWNGIHDGNVGALMAYGFIFFAWLFWPVYSPLSVLALEDRAWRRKILWLLFLIGLIVSGTVLWQVIQNPLIVSVRENSLHYSVGQQDPAVIWTGLGLYALATCGSLLLSTRRAVQIFGVLILIGLGISLYVYLHTYQSVWCFFAAAGSIGLILGSKSLVKEI